MAIKLNYKAYQEIKNCLDEAKNVSSLALNEEAGHFGSFVVVAFEREAFQLQPPHTKLSKLPLYKNHINDHSNLSPQSY